MKLGSIPVAAAAILVSSVAAFADEPAAGGDQAAPAADQGPPPAWIDTITWGGHIEGGVTGNPGDPNDGVNFGHLFNDKANEFLLNQVLYTIQRAPDPKQPDWDIYFKVQGNVGSDSRYTHYIGQLDSVGHNTPFQLDIFEAWLGVHTPGLTDGGIDIKAGEYPTLEGYEVNDASANFFYTHSYAFNFGVPNKHTGVMTITHIIPEIDLYLGIDSGVNTTLGDGDVNNSPAFHGGVGLNLMDGKLTVLASTHIGPEGPNTLPKANEDFRYLNDIVVTYHATDALTLATELNWIRDDNLTGTSAVNGYGIEQYALYTVNDWLAVGMRGEFWRDDQGFFVAQYANNRDFLKVEKGLLTNLNPRSFVGGGRTTYTEWTLGANITPPLPEELQIFKGFMVRPEVRFDSSLSGTKPYIDSTKTSQVTIATDFIIPF